MEDVKMCPKPKLGVSRGHCYLPTYRKGSTFAPSVHSLIGSKLALPNSVLTRALVNVPRVPLSSCPGPSPPC